MFWQTIVTVSATRPCEGAMLVKDGVAAGGGGGGGGGAVGGGGGLAGGDVGGLLVEPGAGELCLLLLLADPLQPVAPSATASNRGRTVGFPVRSQPLSMESLSRENAEGTRGTR